MLFKLNLGELKHQLCPDAHTTTLGMQRL